MVDDTRLELVTSRTSSGCATSCANRPNAIYFKQGVFYMIYPLLSSSNYKKVRCFANRRPDF